MGSLALGGALFAAVVLAWRRTLVAVLVTFAVLAALNWALVLEVLPDFERYKPVPPIAEFVRDRAAPDDVIATYEVAVPSLVYYLRRHVDVYYGPEPFVAAATGERRMFGILSERHYGELAAQIGATTCVLHRVPTFDVKLKNILAQQPLPHLVVISNRCNGPEAR